MNNKNHIIEYLHKLDIVQICKFSWLCGIRALPFLCANVREFAYWSLDYKQRHLYRMFCALDTSFQMSLCNIESFDPFIPIYLAILAAESVTRSIAFINNSDSDAAGSIADHSFNIITGDDIVENVNNSLLYLIDVDADITYPKSKDNFKNDVNINDAIFVAKHTYAHTCAAATKHYNIGTLLVKDIKMIFENRFQEIIIIPNSKYGKLWDNFILDLTNFGYNYWASVYKDLMNDNLNYNQKSFLQRTSVPMKIYRMGAVDVTAYLEKMESQERNGIFISYSHDDEELFNELSTFLKPLEKSGYITYWDDTKIKPGDKWLDEIETALNKAKIAVLLVSPNFLASDFVMTKEVPNLLEAAKNDGVHIFWIPLSASLYNRTPISEYQAASNPGKPLDAMTKSQRNVTLAKICEKLLCLANC